jgi:hypothetical protein
VPSISLNIDGNYSIHFLVAISEYSRCFKVLFKDYLEETCRAVVPQYPGLNLLRILTAKVHFPMSILGFSLSLY